MAVKMIIYPKQEQAYYDAVEREDWYVANLFYMPPIYRPWELIESEMRFEQLVSEYEAEKKFVDELPEELLEVYIKTKFKIKDETKKIPKVRRTWFDWLFSRYKDCD